MFSMDSKGNIRQFFGVRFAWPGLEYYERDKFNILAKAKQQLRECEICNCQNKGGESHITRHNKTRKNINNVKKKDEQ